MGPNMIKFGSVIALFTDSGDSHHHPVLASLSNVSLIRVNGKLCQNLPEES